MIHSASFVFLSCVFSVVSSSTIQLDTGNFESILADNELVFVNFYADWCRFSQLLKPIFEEASNKFSAIEHGKVVFGLIDCDRQPVIAQKYKVSKYPTLKLFRHGQLVKKEYRGQRSIDALSDFVHKQLDYSVKLINETDQIDSALDKKSRNIVGYFSNNDSAELSNFKRVASALRDDCRFWLGIGDWTRSKSISGTNSVFFQGPNDQSPFEYTGPLASYDYFSNWTSDKCVPIVREITFENAEELTEEGLPFLILFRTVPDADAEEAYTNVVINELMDLKGSVNFLLADGKKFAHPLYHLGKTERDLPVLAIDSFRHMYLFPDYNDLKVPGKLRSFIEDLNSGKLHREYHHGPDKDVFIMSEVHENSADENEHVVNEEVTPMEGTEDLGDISERLRQIEEEAQKIREMQTEFNTSASSGGGGSPALNLSLEEKAAIDNRSVFVGNVDYSAKPDQLEEHFRGCGPIERVTILADKYSGHPKGFAYIEFTEPDGKQNALALNESLFLGRQIKVVEKRTNKPGISTTNRPPRGRGRARMVVKYVYPGFRGGRSRSLRRRGFNPY